jgi:hypothetical protein
LHCKQSTPSKLCSTVSVCIGRTIPRTRRTHRMSRSSDAETYAYDPKSDKKAGVIKIVLPGCPWPSPPPPTCPLRLLPCCDLSAAHSCGCDFRGGCGGGGGDGGVAMRAAAMAAMTLTGPVGVWTHVRMQEPGLLQVRVGRGFEPALSHRTTRAEHGSLRWSHRRPGPTTRRWLARAPYSIKVQRGSRDVDARTHGGAR